MRLTRERLAELRALVEDESLSWGDVADLQGAFEMLDPATLRDAPENATAIDMVEELEARMGVGPYLSWPEERDMDRRWEERQERIDSQYDDD